MAEFWADGPKSETPPGHWFVIANGVADNPATTRQLFGAGDPLDPLAWDVHVYLALGGAVHDAAIAAWEQKRLYTALRPISTVRYLAQLGAEHRGGRARLRPATGCRSFPASSSASPPSSAAPGQRHAHLGQLRRPAGGEELARRARRSRQRGRRRRLDPRHRLDPLPAPHVRDAGVPGFHLGPQHVQPRGRRGAGARSPARLTSPAASASSWRRAGAYLVFEDGPSADVRLQWATYFDASDQAGQSRIYGGIHLLPDDFRGRIAGSAIGMGAVDHARTYFDGTARP